MTSRVLPDRHSIRLKDFEYSSNNAYYVTICTQNREMLFGNIIEGKMVLHEMGKIVESVWEMLPQHYSVKLDQFQIMPNHVHMIVVIVGARHASPFHVHSGDPWVAPTLGNIIGSFKSEITKQIRMVKNPHLNVWQRNYYEHVIRNEIELNKIREYIISNPLNWNGDENNPSI